MIIPAEITDAGICLTACPYVPSVRIGSMACGMCKCFFGLENGGVKCNGENFFNEVAGDDTRGVETKKNSMRAVQ